MPRVLCPRRRPAGLVGLVFVGVFATAFATACADSTSADSAQTGVGGVSGDLGAGPGSVPSLDDQGSAGGAAVVPSGDAAQGGSAGPLDAGPQFIDLGGGEPDCTDETCGPGRVCYEGACVDGSRCGPGEPCPGGRICVDGVCIGDPTAAGGLTAEPDQLFFSYSDLGQTIRYTTTLTNHGDAILNITALNVVGSPLFTLPDPTPLPLRLVPEQHIELPVEFVPDDLVPENAVLQIVTDVSGAPPVEVRLQSDHKQVGGEPPCLRVAPAQVNYGLVQRGNTAHQNVNLISCGLAPVMVTRIDRGQTFFGILSDHFDIANRPAMPLLIPAGGTVQLDLTYAPGRAGIESGFWDIRSNDPATPQARIDVSAIAAPPPLEDVGLHIHVSWDTDLTDVDTHVIAPNGQMWTCEGDCYFSNGNPSWGDPNRWEDDPFLDTDDVDGFGPENVNIQEPMNGTYRVVIHYWDTHGGDTPSTVVEVRTMNNLVGTYGPVATPNVDDNWDVVDIDWPGPVVRPLGAVQNRARGGLCGGF